MSENQIEAAADQLRKILGIEADGRVQMVQLIENVLPELLPDYLFCVLPDEDMPGIDGISGIGNYTICLAEHAYVSLCNGEPEARFTAAHEFGHLILHSQQQPALARRSVNDDRVDPEWQADRFADCWLMPRAGVVKCKSAEEVADRFTVTIEAARRRFVETGDLSAEPLSAEKIQGELFI